MWEVIEEILQRADWREILLPWSWWQFFSMNSFCVSFFTPLALVIQEFGIFNETLEVQKTLFIFSCCKSALLLSFI